MGRNKFSISCRSSEKFNNNVIIAFNVLYVKKKKHIVLMFQNISQIIKNKLLFNDSKWRRMVLSCIKKLSALLRGITPKHHRDVNCLNCLHSFPRQEKVSLIKKYMNIKIFLTL